MAIFLDTTLSGYLRTRLDRATGFGEYGRYTAKLNDDGTFTVWAWVNNEARKIGHAPFDPEDPGAVRAALVRMAADGLVAVS
jgi:hypothetical protein